MKVYLDVAVDLQIKNKVLNDSDREGFNLKKNLEFSGFFAIFFSESKSVRSFQHCFGGRGMTKFIGRGNVIFREMNFQIYANERLKQSPKFVKFRS